MTNRSDVRGLRLGGHVIATLARLFPSQFRARFGHEMVATYLDRRDALFDDHSVSLSSRVARVVGLTLRTSVNFVTSAVAERYQIIRRRRFYQATDLGIAVARAEAARMHALLDSPQAAQLLHG